MNITIIIECMQWSLLSRRCLATNNYCTYIKIISERLWNVIHFKRREIRGILGKKPRSSLAPRNNMSLKRNSIEIFKKEEHGNDWDISLVAYLIKARAEADKNTNTKRKVKFIFFLLL